MKRYSFITSCIIALGIAFLWSCNNEETFIDNEIPQTEKGKLSFVLPTGAGKPVTYATVQGSDAEYKIHNLRIYWFVNNGGTDDILHKRFAWGDGTAIGGMPVPNNADPLTLTSQNQSTIATIDVGTYDQPSKFYIVANVNGDATPMITSDALAHIGDDGADCYLSDFEAMLSDALAVSGGKLQLLNTPIAMSIVGNGTPGYIPVANPAAEKNIVTGHLKRRVARFDIMNTSDFTNFEITEIIVTGAQRQGYLQDSTFDISASWASNTGVVSATPATYTGTTSAANKYNGPASSGIDADDSGIFDDYEGANPADTAYLTESAFYLYPTLLKAGKTEISVTGVYNKTVNRVLNIDLSKYTNNELAIEANKVYRIKVLRDFDQRLRLELFVDDWDSVDTVTTVNRGKVITDWGTIASSAQPNESQAISALTPANSYVFEFATSATDPNLRDTLSFVVAGTNLTNSTDPAKRHTSVLSVLPEEYAVAGVHYLQADFDALEAAVANAVSTTELTYAAEFRTTHKIALPATTAPIKARIQIANAINPQDARFITVKSNNYNKSGYKPVEINGVLWAPLNVGADTLITQNVSINVNTDKRRIGDLYQWGRNNAFPTAGTVTTTATKFATPALAEASNLFVTGNGDWLSTPDDNLWSGAKAQGPCPAGWRVPTQAEYTALKGAVNYAGSPDRRYLACTVTATGEKLYFPMASYRGTDGAMGQGTNWDQRGDYWTSTPASNGSFWFAAIATTLSDGTTGNMYRTYGFSVRAVRDVPPAPAAP